MKNYFYLRQLKIFLSCISVILFTCANSTPINNYYPRVGNTDLSKTSQWTTSVNGTAGVSPANFTSPNQFFHITGLNNASPTIAANWTVSGINSYILIGDGVNGVKFIIPSGYKVTATLHNITSLATLIISNKASLTSINWPTDVDPASTVEFLNLGNFTLPILSATNNGFGNIIIDNSSVNNTVLANVAFAGNLTLQNSASFNSTFLSPDLRGSADQTITGNNLSLTVDNFIDTLKTDGNVILGLNTPINFEQDIWMYQSGTTNQFIDNGNTLSCLGNLNMSGTSTGYNITGTIILAGNQGGTTPQLLTDNSQYSFPGAIVAALNNILINCNNPVEFITDVNNDIITINGNFTVATSGYYPITLGTVNAVTGNHTLNLMGDFINNQSMAITYNSSCMYNFNGTSGQTISSAVPNETFSNLIINDSMGITLGSSMYVSGLLKLSNGILTAKDSTVVLTLLQMATCPGGGSSISYVDGHVAKMGNTAFIFPIGGNGMYMPLGITAPFMLTDIITAEFVYSPPTNPFSLPATLGSVSSQAYWNIQQSMSPDPIQVTLYWQNGPSSGIFSYDTTLRVALYSGGIWNDLGNAAYAGNFPNAGSVTASTYPPNINGDFTFGFSTPTPLPITLTSFNATYIVENNSVLIDWNAASQLNNKEFIIEKTIDGKNYTQVGTREGDGTTPFAKSYSMVDYNPSAGVSYYRLRQVDVDGHSMAYAPVPINIATSISSSLDIYPNPCRDNIFISYNSEDGQPITVTIDDISGRTVFTTVFSDVKQGKNNFMLNTSGLSHGLYLLQITDAQKSLYQKILKQ